jgi:hypothetical protein
LMSRGRMCLRTSPSGEIVAGGMSAIPSVTLSILTARFPGVQIDAFLEAPPPPQGAEKANRPRAHLSIRNAERIDQSARLNKQQFSPTCSVVNT